MIHGETVIEATSRRTLAISQLAQTVATLYNLQVVEVLDDAARFAGADSYSDIPPDLQKPVLDYLSGRITLPG